ncbi:sugar-binding transcriptional regulator [Oceanispirochaeta sp.]|uniref:sugar-binding transcriptional regulator n=1 Tax=Oceanispirochaeta sp. TaxID=2035350 RepID=UPI0026036297|nr:sugar-binding domain-containing protein [Oceanispirochaeta sp.]MDA3957634.1 hypothetical protein [Oceanispirochaeta sp.]
MPKLPKDDLVIRCAYLFYKERLNIKGVAERLDISRFKVSRYLKEAEDAGIVEVRFNIPDLQYQSLAMDIEEIFPVKRVVIVPVSADMSSEDVRRSVGHKGTEILKEFLNDLSIGVTWGRTIADMVQDLPEREVQCTSIAELTGGFGMISPKISTSSLAPLLAQKTNALCYQMHGPILSSNVTIAQSLLSDNSIVRTLNVSRKCDVAIFGMTPLNKNALLYRSDLITEQDIEYLKGKGVLGTILGRFFNASGEEVETPFKDQAVSISWNNFLNIPERMALIGGVEKAKCIRSLMKAGIMTTVIMDSITAKAVLEETDSKGSENEL